MTTRIGINGYGRMGRLALRAIEARLDLEVVAINEPNAPVETLATLTEFDSQQGRFEKACHSEEGHLVVDSRPIPVSSHTSPAEISWSDHQVDIVLECSGKFRRQALLEPHLERGAKRVVVSVPVKDGPPNIVVGVNHDAFDLAASPIVTAASCTTNALAPIVRVIHDGLGIERGLVTTIHCPTNTQSVVDAPHEDPRRARAAQLNLIPTSTNSATAVTLIIPELAGKLDSIAVRAPIINASLVDCVFQLSRDTTIDELNALLAEASHSPRLEGILGFETRPLVSGDYAGDPRSSIIDAASTRVTDHRLVKLLAWYDNEWGYVNRMVELTALITSHLP